ncbi:unnamed protein product [Ectocarpus sp. 4 AP-2014]
MGSGRRVRHRWCRKQRKVGRRDWACCNETAQGIAVFSSGHHAAHCAHVSSMPRRRVWAGFGEREREHGAPRVRARSRQRPLRLQRLLPRPDPCLFTVTDLIGNMSSTVHRNRWTEREEEDT